MVDSADALTPSLDRDLVPTDERGYAIAAPGTFDLTQFTPQGPVGAAFLADKTHLMRGLMGPWGSGKTNLAFMDMFQWAVMAPVCVGAREGQRLFCACIVRDTYRNLETTIKSWHAWATPQDGAWTGGSGDRPALHLLEYDLIDGTRLMLRVEFRAIGDKKVEDAMLGAEFNWLFPNELTTLPIDIITYGLGRLGRYPHPKELGYDQAKIAARPNRIVTDFNAPEVGTPVYKYFEEELPETAKLYRQPGGRSPMAENVRNLPPNYYANQITANASRPWWIKRFIDNEYGFSRAGLPVFQEEYKDELHCQDFGVEDLPIYLGIDGGMGLHPALVVLQWSPNGWIKIPLSHFVGRCGPARFADSAKVMLAQHCKGLPIAGAFIDPSAFRGYDAESGEMSFVDVLSRAINAPIQPCWTNELGPRLDGWRKPLGRMVGGVPMLRVSSRCFSIRRALNSEYRYKIDNNGALTQDVKPEKNEASHEMDAGGYGLLGMLGQEFILHDKDAKPRYVPLGGKGNKRGGGNGQMRTDFNP